MRERAGAWAAGLTCILLLQATAVRGEPLPRQVTFAEALRLAAEQSRDVHRASAAILRAEALLLDARAAVRPALEAALVQTRLDETTRFDGQVTQPGNQFTATAVASARVLDAAGWAARAQAADRAEIARLAAADVRREVAQAAAQAYLAVMAQRRQAEVEARARETASAQLDFAQVRYEGGLGSKLNALRAAEELATGEVRLTRARLALALSREALGLVLATDGPVDAADEPDFTIPESAAEDWLSTRTDIRLSTARRDAASRVVADSWKDWVPSLELSFTPRYADPTGLFERDTSWRAALAAEIPIYDGGGRRASRLQREADLRSTEIDLEQAELRARAEERAARAAVTSAEEGLASALAAARHAGEVLEITDVAFRAGATTNIEVIDAQRRARDAETAAAAAEDLLRRARLDLLVALGLFPG